MAGANRDMSQSGVLLTLRYKLTQEECLECLRLMDSAKVKAKRINETVLFVLALIFLALYLYRPQMGTYLLLALLLTATLFALHYLPDIKRRRRAAKMAGQRGEYRIKIYADGRVELAQGACSLHSEGCKLLESENLYLISTGEYRLCIPKRERPQSKLENFKALLQDCGLR